MNHNEMESHMDHNDQTELADLRAEVAAWRGRFGADVAVVGDPDPDRTRRLERALEHQRVDLAAARRAAAHWRNVAEGADR